MQSIWLRSHNDFGEWRSIARALLLGTVSPDEVAWNEPGRGTDLLNIDPGPAPAVLKRAVGTVPRKFIQLGAIAICHADPERFALLYRLLWRLQRDHSLLSMRSDPDVGKLDRRVAAVRTDTDRLTASVRFHRFAAADGGDRFVAWYEPEHYVLERAAPDLDHRFRGVHWGIVTPYRSALWNGEALTLGTGGNKVDVPAESATDLVWQRYHASIFGSAPVSVAAASEAPANRQRNLPEAELIPPLTGEIEETEETMTEQLATTPPPRHARHAEPVLDAGPDPEIGSLAAARKAAASCRRCPLYQYATQTVFGEGPQTAHIMFVGEQPGDQEDLAGKPFVGPAGQVFDAALAVAGIERSQVFVTNAVKHFKFEPRGKRRIHQKPNAGEIRACRFWLGLEREFVRPQVVVAMGATAVASLLGKSAAVSALRGKPTTLDDGTPMWVTVHPSYLLRLQDRSAAAEERRRFEADLRAIREFAESLPART